MSDSEQQLDDEIEQTFKTLVALLERRDRVVEQTGNDPLDGIGHLIKSAGKLRDLLDARPTSRSVNPDEVFDE